jgi:hypothetical protein
MMIRHHGYQAAAIIHPVAVVFGSSGYSCSRDNVVLLLLGTRSRRRHVYCSILVTLTLGNRKSQNREAKYASVDF